MPFDVMPDNEALAVAEMYAEAGHLPGYLAYQTESAIIEYLEGLRTREAQRQFLNQALRPFGFFVSSYRNWRGECWQ